MHRDKTAFSLVEISIVLVIIAMITMVIPKGISIINNAKHTKAVAAAQQLYGMQGIVLWYDVFMNDKIDLLTHSWQNRINNGINTDLPPTAQYFPQNALASQSFVSGIYLPATTSLTVGGGYPLDIYYTVVMVLATTKQTTNGILCKSSTAGFTLSKGSTSHDNVTLPQPITTVPTGNYFPANKVAAVIMSNGNHFRYQLLHQGSVGNIIEHATPANALGTLTVGGDASQFYVMEIIVFNRELSDIEFSKVSDYLQTKYNM